MADLQDDDGVIDLNAIQKSASIAPRAPVAPLFADTPSAMAVEAGGPSPASTKGGGLKLGLMIGGGALFVTIVIVGLAFAFRGETPTPRVAAPVLSASAPAALDSAAAAAASASAAPAASVASADDGSDDDDKSAAPTKKKKRFKPGGFSPKPGGASAAPAKPVKAADPCHCHGDFQCNIRCSAGR